MWYFIQVKHLCRTRKQQVRIGVDRFFYHTFEHAMTHTCVHTCRYDPSIGHIAYPGQIACNGTYVFVSMAVIEHILNNGYLQDLYELTWTLNQQYFSTSGYPKAYPVSGKIEVPGQKLGKKGRWKCVSFLFWIVWSCLLVKGCVPYVGSGNSVKKVVCIATWSTLTSLRHLLATKRAGKPRSTWMRTFPSMKSIFPLGSQSLQVRRSLADFRVAALWRDRCHTTDTRN